MKIRAALKSGLRVAILIEHKEQNNQLKEEQGVVAVEWVFIGSL